MEEVDRLVMDVITDLIQIERRQIWCYLFEKSRPTATKDGLHLVYPDVVIGKEMKRKLLRGITKCARKFDGLGT